MLTPSDIYYILEFLKAIVQTLPHSVFIGLLTGFLVAILVIGFDIFLIIWPTWKDNNFFTRIVQTLSVSIIVTDLAVGLVFAAFFLLGFSLVSTRVLPDKIAAIPTPTLTPIPTHTPTPTATSTVSHVTPQVIHFLTPTITPTPQSPLVASITQQTSLTPSITTQVMQTISNCNQEVAIDKSFVNLWLKYYFFILKCPLEKALGPEEIYFVKQVFENGHMFYLSRRGSSEGTIFVTYGTASESEDWQAKQGNFDSFPSGLWSEKKETFCSESENLEPPIYSNFNQIWCNNEQVRTQLGYAKNVDSELETTQSGANSKSVLVQYFEAGFMLQDEEGAARGLAYIFFSKDYYIRNYN